MIDSLPLLQPSEVFHHTQSPHPSPPRKKIALGCILPGLAAWAATGTALALPEDSTVGTLPAAMICWLSGLVITEGLAKGAAQGGLAAEPEHLARADGSLA
jgi:hypothetical protein